MAFTKEEWWKVDKSGRRIGWLWPEDFTNILEDYYGHKNWAKEFAAEVGFAYSTVDRYKNGRTPIPRSVAALVNAMGMLKHKNITMPKLKAQWLPDAEGANGTLGDPKLFSDGY